jgi:hypothetical protein
MEREGDYEIVPGGHDPDREHTEGVGPAGEEIVGEVDVRGGTEYGTRARGSRLEPDLSGEAGTPSQRPPEGQGPGDAEDEGGAA